VTAVLAAIVPAMLHVTRVAESTVVVMAPAVPGAVTAHTVAAPLLVWKPAGNVTWMSPLAAMAFTVVNWIVHVDVEPVVCCAPAADNAVNALAVMATPAAVPVSCTASAASWVSMANVPVFCTVVGARMFVNVTVTAVLAAIVPAMLHVTRVAESTVVVMAPAVPGAVTAHTVAAPLLVWKPAGNVTWMSPLAAMAFTVVNWIVHVDVEPVVCWAPEADNAVNALAVMVSVLVRWSSITASTLLRVWTVKAAVVWAVVGFRTLVRVSEVAVVAPMLSPAPRLQTTSVAETTVVVSLVTVPGVVTLHSVAAPELVWNPAGKTMRMSPLAGTALTVVKEKVHVVTAPVLCEAPEMFTAVRVAAEAGARAATPTPRIAANSSVRRASEGFMATSTGRDVFSPGPFDQTGPS
jgi:hypothetical protein